MKNNERHGLSIADVRGSIRRPVSYWAIDESGNPSRKMSEDGKIFTLSAMTALSDIDYDTLLKGVPLYDGEVHFSYPRNEHPDIALELMSELGKQNILVLSKPVRKKGKFSDKEINRKRKHKKDDSSPIDELYLLSLFLDILDAIMVIDISDTVIVTYDQSSNITESACEIAWTDRILLVMAKSHAIRLLQMADLSASSLGRAMLPEEFAEDSYFMPIRAKSVNLDENGHVPQHVLTILPGKHRCTSYIKFRSKSFFDRFLRKGGRK